MMKSLRFSLLSMLLMLAGTSMAQNEVTLDFNENTAALFPTFTTYSSGTGNNYVADGEFNADTESEAIDGVSVVVTASDAEAGTRNRLWNTAPRLRLYDGSLTVKSADKEMVKMEITRSTNKGLVANQNTVDTGELTTSDQQLNAIVTWTGKAQQVVITIAGNTQIGKIVVYFADEEEPVVAEKGSLENPYTPAEATEAASALEADAVTEAVYYVKGFVSEIKYTFNAQYGTATFYIADEATNTEGQFLCYGVKYLENKPWVKGYQQVEVGQEVIVCGKLVNYEGATPEIASNTGYIYSLNGQTKAEETEEPVDKETISVAEALALIAPLADNGKTEDTYQVKGIVVTAPDFQRKSNGSLYGNVNFEIADTEDGTETLTVFRAKNLGNVSFTEETINQFAVGDEVVIEGLLQKYVKDDVTTPEIVSCYLVQVTTKEVATGITSVQGSELTVQDVYSLSGQRVAQPRQGLYIKNGKKVIVK